MGVSEKQDIEKILVGQISVDDREESITNAIDRADELIGMLSLDAKDAMHVRLLFEETMGLLKAMTGMFDAEVSFEKTTEECRVLVNAWTKMDIDKKTELIAVSTSGKNAAAKGFMGKIADIIETGLLGYDDVMRLQQSYGGEQISYGGLGVSQIPGGVTSPEIIWSLKNYKEGLNEALLDVQGAAKEAWDELEKSIVANVAKDVIVGVKKNKVNLVIVYGITGK